MGELRQRQPRVRDKDYLGAIAKLPCIACMAAGTVRWGVHVAHVRMAIPDVGWREVGKAEKPDDLRTAPICPMHHTDGRLAQHKIGEPAFWRALGINPAELCIALRVAYDAGTDMVGVIATFAAAGRKARQ